MATKKKKVDPAEIEEKKEYNAFQWILFVAVIPLLFALTIALVVMTIAGVNVFEKTKEIAGKVPYVSEWIAPAEQDGKLDSEKVVELQAEIKNKEAEIEQLSDDLESSKAEIEELLTEQDRLNAKLKQLQQQQTEAAESDETETVNNVAETYESMDEESIAGIVINLTNNEAVAILQELSVEKQAAVLENLDAKKAAEYTKILSNE
jgi:flagellar protein FlbB